MRKMLLAIDARESVTAPFGLCRQRGTLRFRGEDIGRLAPCGVVIGRAPLGLPDRLSGPFFVNDLGDADAIIRKDPLAADGLDIMMAGVGPPRRQNSLVLPDLVGQQQVLPRQTPEAIDEAAATHRLEVGLQRRPRDRDIDCGARALSGLQRTGQSSKFLRGLRSCLRCATVSVWVLKHQPHSVIGRYDAGERPCRGVI